MILRRRVRSTDARTAALDVFATTRFLAALGVEPARLWIDAGERHDALRPRAVQAWSDGIGVVAVADGDARDAAAATAAALGADVVEPPEGAPDDAVADIDGRWRAARHALGLDPGDVVELVVGQASSIVTAERLADFDARATAESPTRGRLILIARPGPDARITAELISAIVHPLVLIHLGGADTELIDLARFAADEVVEGG